MIHFMVVWDLVDWVSMTTSTTNMVTGPITNSPINHILFTSMTPAMVMRKGKACSIPSMKIAI